MLGERCTWAYRDRASTPVSVSVTESKGTGTGAGTVVAPIPNPNSSRRDATCKCRQKPNQKLHSGNEHRDEPCAQPG